MMMFAASLAHAAWSGYTEDRELQLDATSVEALEIDAGAGGLNVIGDAGIDSIQVKATIRVPDEKSEKAQKIIASDLTLSLEEVRGRAILKAFFEDGSWGWGDSPSVDVEVRMPEGLILEIDDSSGSLTVVGVAADVSIDDGSGSIKVERVGSVAIDDGSGSIKVVDVSGDVSIEDGSGSISIHHVGGSVVIDDGSGGIDVDDVEHDLTIVNDGSGSLNATNVRGKVTEDT
jgi:hypothetical protein